MSNPDPPTPAFVNAYLDLLVCACSLVESEGQGAVCWCGMHPGDSASWEYCETGCGEDGACGMLYLRPGVTFPYETFPVQSLDNVTCEMPLAFEVSIGVVRCFPTMEEDGEFPAADIITNAALGMEMDKAALYKAIKCCESSFISTYSVGQWTPLGPQGGCVSGEWAMVLAVD